MSERLSAMYSQRLASLTQTLSYITQAVGVDEALALLNDQHLIQYKIDRITQLVKDILTSQKEKIIIHLILKIEALQNIQHPPTFSQPATDQTHLLYYRKRLEQKTEEAEKLKLEVLILKEQLQQQKVLFSEQKQHFEMYQNKQRQILQKCEMLQQEKQKEIQIRLQIQKQQSIQGFSQQLKRLAQAQKVNLATISRLQAQNNHLISNQQTQQTSNKKRQKIQALKKDIKKLNIDLNEMKQMVNIITYFISTSLKKQLRILKQGINQLSKYFVSGLNVLQKEILKQFGKMNWESSKEDKLMKRMQMLEGEIDKFIQSEII